MKRADSNRGWGGDKVEAAARGLPHRAPRMSSWGRGHRQMGGTPRGSMTPSPSVLCRRAEAGLGGRPLSREGCGPRGIRGGWGARASRQRPRGRTPRESRSDHRHRLIRACLCPLPPPPLFQIVLLSFIPFSFPSPCAPPAPRPWPRRHAGTGNGLPGVSTPKPTTMKTSNSQKPSCLTDLPEHGTIKDEDRVLHV